MYKYPLFNIKCITQLFLISLVLFVSSIFQAHADDGADLSEIGTDPRKTLVVKAIIRSDGTAELVETFIADSPPGTNIADPPLILLEYLDIDGHPVDRRDAWDPRWQFQQGDDGEEEKIDLPEGVGSFGIRLSAEMATVVISDQRTSKELLQVDVSDMVRQYCENNPGYGDCFFLEDSDSDAIPDAIDNCTEVANMMQTDTDFDGHGNACDADLNNDNFVNSLDLGIFKQMFTFSGDMPADFNGDFIVNSLDLGMFKQMFFKPPGPSAVVPPGP